MAEGFVKENGQVKEEVADAYLNKLVHRNLIQVTKRSRVGRIRGLRVHDTLREIIRFKALEQNFAIIIPGQDTEPSNKFSCLAIHRFDGNIFEGNSLKLRLRSLLLFTQGMDSASLSNMLSLDYIPLKVLDLKCTKLEEIPKEVFNLFHLKYLNLRSTGLRNIPKSIERLQNLETLDLKYTKVVELPIEIETLHKLQHLIVDYGWPCGFNAPFKIGGLLFLQKLCYIQANKTNGIKVVSEIGKLTQLRKLGVRNLRQEDGKQLCSSLENLTYLCSLSLNSDGAAEILDIQHSLSAVPLCLRTLRLNGSLMRVPEWLSSLVSLTQVDLMYSRLLEDPLPLLQDLPMLAHLQLFETYKGEGLCFKAGKFSKIKLLSISYFTALKWLVVEEGGMPLLEELHLAECKLLEQVPVGIQHLSKLMSIVLDDMFEKLVFTLDPNDKNYPKISHIPHIKVIY